MWDGITGGVFICEVPKSLSYIEWSSVRYLWSISCFLLWLNANEYVFKVQHCWGMLIFSSGKNFSVTCRHVSYQTPWFYFLKEKYKVLALFMGGVCVCLFCFFFMVLGSMTWLFMYEAILYWYRWVCQQFTEYWLCVTYCEWTEL